MTRKEKVKWRKEGIVEILIKEAHKATNLERGLKKMEEFIIKQIVLKPQEKSFYLTCGMEAKAILEAKSKEALHGKRNSTRRSNHQESQAQG